MGNLSREYIVYMPLDYIAQLCHAVMDMSVDKSYQLPTKGNDICLRAAKNVAASLQTPSEETSVFCDWLITNLNKIMDGSVNSSGSLNREKLWTEYYQLQISPAFTEKWGGFLQSVSAPTEAIFLNQARARAWFLRIASIRESMRVCVFACVCVFVRPRGY